jgi:hypothetical protein
MFVESGDLYEACSWLQAPIWILVRSDGLLQTFSTAAVPPSPHPVWRSPARLIINLADLEGSHFKATLCTSGPTGAPIAIGTSQVRLSTLPFGSPSRLSFPLKSCQNYSITVETLTIKATISLLPAPAPPQPASVPKPNPVGRANQVGIPIPGSAAAMPQAQMMPPLVPRRPWTGYPGAPEVRQQMQGNQGRGEGPGAGRRTW